MLVALNVLLSAQSAAAATRSAATFCCTPGPACKLVSQKENWCSGATDAIVCHSIRTVGRPCVWHGGKCLKGYLTIAPQHLTPQCPESGPAATPRSTTHESAHVEPPRESAHVEPPPTSFARTALPPPPPPPPPPSWHSPPPPPLQSQLLEDEAAPVLTRRRPIDGQAGAGRFAERSRRPPTPSELWAQLMPNGTSVEWSTLEPLMQNLTGRLRERMWRAHARMRQAQTQLAPGYDLARSRASALATVGYQRLRTQILDRQMPAALQAAGEGGTMTWAQLPALLREKARTFSWSVAVRRYGLVPVVATTVAFVVLTSALLCVLYKCCTSVWACCCYYSRCRCCPCCRRRRGRHARYRQVDDASIASLLDESDDEEVGLSRRRRRMR